MMKSLVLVAIGVFAVFAVFAQENKIGESGIARLEGKYKNSVVKGLLTFTLQAQDQMLVTGKLTGMPPGQYALNIHEKGDLSESCKRVGGHLNPHGHNHGHPGDEHRHVGDLGNIEFDKSGIANVKITDRLIKLWGVEGIIGRAVALASMKDDHGKTEHPQSPIDGNAGEVVACGVIGVK